MVQKYLRNDSPCGPIIDPNEVFSQKTIFQFNRHKVINNEKARFKYQRKDTYNVIIKNRARTDEAGMTVESSPYSIEGDQNCESQKNVLGYLSQSGVTMGGSSGMIIEEPELENNTSRVYGVDQSILDTTPKSTKRRITNDSNFKFRCESEK